MVHLVIFKCILLSYVLLPVVNSHESTPATINSWLGLDLFHAATLPDYTFFFAFVVTVFMSLKGDLVSRKVNKVTSESGTVENQEKKLC